MTPKSPKLHLVKGMGNHPAARGDDARSGAVPTSLVPGFDGERNFVNRDLILALVDGRLDIEIVFQPIIDLAHGVVAGYESLTRFPSPPVASPDVWFREAERFGLGPELEALSIRRARLFVDSLPDETYLTINVSPHLLTALPIQQAFAGDLSRIVVELTEHVQVTDMDPVLREIDALRRRGAILAMDDTGSGYSGLRQLTLVKPEMIKLDRELVTGIDGDEVKETLASMLTEFAHRMGCWLLAEGVETHGELDVLLRLGVPLGQGWIFGRPNPSFIDVDPQVARYIGSSRLRDYMPHQVGSLLEAVATSSAEEMPDASLRFDAAVWTDDFSHPRLLWLRRDEGESPWTSSAVTLTVSAEDAVAEVASRLLQRDDSTRYTPVVCVDEAGRVLGIVRVDSVIRRLVQSGQVVRLGEESTTDLR